MGLWNRENLLQKKCEDKAKRLIKTYEKAKEKDPALLWAASYNNFVAGKFKATANVIIRLKTEDETYKSMFEGIEKNVWNEHPSFNSLKIIHRVLIDTFGTLIENSLQDLKDGITQQKVNELQSKMQEHIDAIKNDRRAKTRKKYAKLHFSMFGLYLPYFCAHPIELLDAIKTLKGEEPPKHLTKYLEKIQV